MMRVYGSWMLLALSLGATGCNKREAPSGAPPATSAPPPASATATTKAEDAPLTKGPRHIEGENFALDLTAPECHAGAECTVAIKLAIAGSYHVNQEYPYKFVATPARGVAFLGKALAANFSKADGDFVAHDAKSATMTVRFKPSVAGTVPVAGTYKLSVCSEEHCQLEQMNVGLLVDVL